MRVLLLLAGMIATAAPPSADPTLPFRYDDTRLWISVTFPGHAHAPASFVLDDGVSGTLIDESLARELGLSAVARRTTTGVGGGSTQVADSGPLRLSVGGVPFTAAHVTVAPLEKLLAPTSGRHVDGILGAPFFHQHVVDLDFERRVITLHEPKSFAYRGSGALIPVRFAGGVPIGRAAMTLPDGHTLALEVLLDLGAKTTLLLSEPTIARTGLRRALPDAIERPLGAGMGGPTRYAFARVRALALASAPRTRVEGPVVGLSVHGVLAAGWYDGLLGAGFLSRFRVIFDDARSRVILEPTPRTQVPDRFDPSGLFLEARGADLATITIAEVRPGSPAAAAGLAPGDVLHAIDGVASSHFSLGELRDRLADLSAAQVTLELVHDGRPRTVHLTLLAAL